MTYVQFKYEFDIVRDKWGIPYAEIQTVPSRKELLDYTGELYEYVQMLTSTQP